MRAVAATALLPIALVILASAPAAGAELAYDLAARPLQGLPSSMAALILSGHDGGEILFSPLALPLGPVQPGREAAEGEAARHGVALLLEVDGASFLGSDPPDVTDLEVYAYVLTPQAAVSGFLSQRVSIDLETYGEAVAAGGVKLVAHLEVPPGSYELRLLVHEPSSRRYGLQALPLEVPQGGPALSPPLVQEAREAPAPWILVAESRRGDDTSVDVSTLLDRAGVPLPSALPVLGTETLELDALLYGAGPGIAPESLRARLRSLSEGGSTVDVPVSLVDSVDTEIDDARRLHLSLPLDVDTGAYFLRLAARIGGTQVESPEVGVVVQRGTVTGSLVWTDVQRRIRGEPPRAELELGATRRRRARVAELTRAASAAYRTVLQRLATGDREGAVEDLLRIERQAIEEEGGRFSLLHEAEMAVVEPLLAADPEALVPIARLHHLAYRRTREEGRFALAAHSRSMATTVAERYAAAGGEGAAEIASELLAAVGDELQQARVYRGAREHLSQALALDPGNTFALLQLAVGAERAGEYGRAADLLERLVAADPKSPEARLRLGINLLRLGRDRQGRTVLDRLVREHNPDWVLTVAFEELAMERLRSGDLDGAVTLLQQALARLPSQGRLAIQLAYALDRADRRHAAHDALDRLTPSADREPSPRHLYSLWPAGGREEIDRSIARAAVLRLPALGNALAASRGQEGGP